MKNRTLRLLALSQLLVLLLFFCTTMLNELIDLPHYFFGDMPTTFGQRMGEIYVELAIFTVIMSIEFLLLRHLSSRIRLLEGFLPICANCKKIRKEGEWEQMEKYITEHSLVQALAAPRRVAQTSHSAAMLRFGRLARNHDASTIDCNN